MKKITSAFLTLYTLALLLPLSGCGYNQLQGLDEEVKGAWAEVQNQYQRRADLVPNLVATVKGAAKFEQDTLQQVRSEEHTSELQSRGLISYAVFCLKKKY